MAFLTIAKVTLLGSVRKPAFYLAVAVFGTLVFISHFLTVFTLGEPTSMVEEVGVSSIFLCGVLASIFLGAQTLSSEIESGTLPVILTRPPGRRRVLLAKFAGVVITAWSALVLLLIIFLITLALDGKPFGTLSLQAVVLAFLAPVLAAASTLALSTFLPFAPTVLVSLSLFVLGSLSGYLLSVSTGILKILLSGLFAVIPDYSLLNLTNLISSGKPIGMGAFFWAVLYALAYGATALAIGCMIFSRREIK